MHFQFDKAFQILIRTWPYVALRAALYLLAMALSILWFGGLFFLFRQSPFPGPAWIVWVVGGIAYSYGVKLFRSYLFYLLKAAHIAVITRLAVDGELPAGENQIGFGKDIVVRHFARVTILFGVDRLVGIVLRAFNRSVFQLVSFVPLKGGLRKFFQQVLDYSAGYVDEAILSYSLLYPERNPWSTARDGLLLYVQNWRTILGSGFVLALMSYALVAVVAAPGILFSLTLVEPLRQIVIGISVGVGLLVKLAIMDPFALTSVIVNYHSVIAGQPVSPEWDGKLEKISGKFREIKDRAGSWSPRPDSADRMPGAPGAAKAIQIP